MRGPCLSGFAKFCGFSNQALNAELRPRSLRHACFAQGFGQVLRISGSKAQGQPPLMLPLQRHGGIELQGLGDRRARLTQLPKLRVGGRLVQPVLRSGLVRDPVYRHQGILISMGEKIRESQGARMLLGMVGIQ
jgi:hypothetical protein